MSVLDHRFKVKEFSVVEIVPYPICLSWEGQGSAPGADSMATGGETKIWYYDVGYSVLFVGLVTPLTASILWVPTSHASKLRVYVRVSCELHLFSRLKYATNDCA